MTTTSTKRASASRLAAKDPTLAAPSRLKLQLYGPPGVGKTWGTLEFPACYYIDTEGGANLLTGSTFLSHLVC